MTKDRRLGRGLAALLGTPLEEDGLVDGGSVALADGAAGPRPTGATAARPVPRSPNAAAAHGASGPARLAASQPARGAAAEASPGGRTRPGNGGASGGGSHSAASNERGGSRPASVADTSPSSESSPDSASPSTPSTQTLELSVDEIDNNPFQPRRKFNESEIAALAESIREHAQLQPILVRRVGQRFQLISGERRLRATIHAGLKTIRAEVREADDRLVAELAIVENLQRKDLDAIEKAMSFRRYIDQHKCTQEDLAKRLTIDRSTIANLMRLLELPAEIQSWIQNETLTAGHARTLLPLGDEAQQLDFARRIVEETWTVRQTEQRVSEQLAAEDGQRPPGATRGPRKRITPQLAALEQQLRLSLGAKVEIRQSARGRGKFVIHFTNVDEFERLRELISPESKQEAA